MGWFSHDSEEARAYEQVQNATTDEHKASLSHEVIAAAASYEAAKAYQEHCETHGKPSTHEKAKELIAALTGAFIDREVESKGLDFIDKEKVKRHANERSVSALDASRS